MVAIFSIGVLMLIVMVVLVSALVIEFKSK